MSSPEDGSSSSCTFSDSFCCEDERGEYEVIIQEEERDQVDEEEEGTEEDETVFVLGEGEASVKMGSFESNSESRSRSAIYEEGPPDLVSRDSGLSVYETNNEEESVAAMPNIIEELPKKQSIFVHSSPTQFPDITKARKSAFGSIFVRAPVTKQPGSGSSRKTAASGQFNMIPVFLDYIEEGSSADSGKRPTMKGSIFRAFEKSGIAKEVSTSSDSQWDVYPITKSALFSIQIHDRIHQTRNLSKVEERILSTPVQVLKFAHTWPSGSTWTGHWDGLGMAGAGTYIMPHEVCYIGKMQDGMCHDDDATLIYPNGFKALHCNYVNGELTDYQFEFPDSLSHEKENWEYCQYPDRSFSNGVMHYINFTHSKERDMISLRKSPVTEVPLNIDNFDRFWSEVQNGLKPAKIAQKTQIDPPRKIPQDFYDTNDGFYNPKTKVLLGNEGKLLRVPTNDEEKWIKAKCRKGFHEYSGFRPEFYENWYNNDKEFIQTIMDMQEKYSAGVISYEEFYQFYADINLLPTCSPFKKTKTPSETTTDKMSESYPSPKKLVYRLEKRFQGHRIPPRETSIGTPRKPRKSMKRSKVKNESRAPSQAKFSWKIKFNEGNKTPTASIANSSIEEKDSKSILKKGQQPEDAKKETYDALRPGSLVSLCLNAESAASVSETKTTKEIMKDIVMDIVMQIVLEERERHRNRFVKTQSVGNLSFGPRDEKEACLRVLEELHSSIPDENEFCDSAPQYSCDLKKLAQDRFQMVKYWGKRIFTLSYDERA